MSIGPLNGSTARLFSVPPNLQVIAGDGVLTDLHDTRTPGVYMIPLKSNRRPGGIPGRERIQPSHTPIGGVSVGYARLWPHAPARCVYSIFDAVSLGVNMLRGLNIAKTLYPAKAETAILKRWNTNIYINM